MRKIPLLEVQNFTNNVFYELLGTDIEYGFGFTCEVVGKEGMTTVIHYVSLLFNFKFILVKQPPQKGEAWKTKLGYIYKPIPLDKETPEYIRLSAERINSNRTVMNFTFEDLEDYKHQLTNYIKRQIKKDAK